MLVNGGQYTMPGKGVQSNGRHSNRESAQACYNQKQGHQYCKKEHKLCRLYAIVMERLPALAC